MGKRSSRLIVAGILLAIAAVAAAQEPAQSELDRVNERIRALQREADELATRERSLLVELRRLEVQRQLRAQEASRAEAAYRETKARLDATVARAAALRQTADAERPEVEARLVHLYKLGRAGYWRLLLDVEDLRSMGRAYRTAAAMSHLDRERIQQHQRTLEALAAERAALEARTSEAAAL